MIAGLTKVPSLGDGAFSLDGLDEVRGGLGEGVTLEMDETPGVDGAM